MRNRNPRSRRLSPTLAVLVVPLFLARAAEGQTFVQLTELGSGIGPRLTRSVTQTKINRLVFSATSGKVTYVDLSTVYQFTADPIWNRVVIWKKDTWTHEFTNDEGPGGRLAGSKGVDVSAQRKVYVADRGKGRVLYATFDAETGNLVSPNELYGWLFGQPVLRRPVDVAWDGQGNPMTQDYLYVLDQERSLVTYWDMNSTPSPGPIWSFGGPGSGTGQFLDPAGICVGKTPAASGGTQFTASFYVVDRGNKRLVWLSRGSAGATWTSSTSLGDWDPNDCAVDHFGNVYVADRTKHRIHKFTSSLSLLASYGAFGRGPSALNTFAFPHTISVPCGLKVVNSQTVWYCEGRVLTAEDWSDATGAVEHYLGIDGSITGGPDTSGGRATLSYRVTDHAYHTIRLVRDATSQVYLEWWRGLMPPGQHSWFWSGSETDPEGYYHFEVLLTSAYGCSSQPWCARSLWSASFWHAGSPPPPPPPPDCDPDCVSAPAPDDAPATLFLRQRLSTAGRPLARIAGPAASAPSASATTPSGSLSEVVRQHGVRGLSFGIPRGASPALVAIRVYSVAGRPVRTLVNEVVEPGYYEVAWDGLDDRGRAAAPGVYFAVLTAGGQRVVQRLILRQAP